MQKPAPTLIDNEKEISNGEEILKMQQEFYQELYRKDENTSFKKPSYDPDSVCPGLIKDRHEEQLSMEEIQEAVRT